MSQRTPEQQKTVIDQLLASLREEDAVLGLVVPGATIESAENGYGGIRLWLVIKDGIDLAAAYQSWWEHQGESLPVLHRFQNPSHGQFGLLLEGYIPVELRPVHIDDLVIPMGEPSLVFDRSGKLKEQLAKSTLTAEKRRAQYIHTIQAAWLPVIECATVLKHEDIWRALHLLNVLRDITVTVAALRHEVNIDEYRGMSQLPEMFLVQLRHTLPLSTSVTALRRALRATAQLLFVEAQAMDEECSVQTGHELRALLVPYLEAHG